MPSTRLLVASLALPPTAALFVATYLGNHPLHSSYMPLIHYRETLSPSCATSKSIDIINPTSHVYMSDTRFLVLEAEEIGKLGDEEILARFTHGFFNGWIFIPERYLLTFLGVFGHHPFAVHFTGVSMDGPMLKSPSQLQRQKLPEKGMALIEGNFFVLDVHIKQTTPGNNSFVDVAYGDDKKDFSGFHRFEVTRTDKDTEKGNNRETTSQMRDKVTISFSSVSCNPSKNTIPFPAWALGLHKWYAMELFRDGIREVLSI